MEGVGSSPSENSEGSFLPHLLISICGITATTIAIVAYHLIFKYLMMRRRWRSERLTISGSSQTLHQFAKGIEEKVLLTIPILAYSTKDYRLFRVDQSECAICLGELEDGEMVRLLPSCRHAFHVPCIGNWFLGHTSCPVCRSPVVDQPKSISEGAANLPIDDNNNNNDNRNDQERLHRSASSSRVELLYSNDFLRHSVSLVMPIEDKQQLLATTLKRSLSMDECSSYVAVRVQNDDHIMRKQESDDDHDQSCSSSSSITARSMKQLDRVSSRVVRSFSQLRIGSRSSNTTANGNLLPC